jgi:hypothetical protein
VLLDAGTHYVRWLVARALRFGFFCAQADALRRLQADTARTANDLQREEHALRQALGQCQLALGEGAVAAEQAAQAAQLAWGDLEARRLAGELRLGGELRAAQHEGR